MMDTKTEMEMEGEEKEDVDGGESSVLMLDGIPTNDTTSRRSKRYPRESSLEREVAARCRSKLTTKPVASSQKFIKLTLP
jgi:hypothetical protein